MNTNQEREGMEVGCGGHCTNQCNRQEGRAIVGQGCTPGSEDVGVADESVVGCDVVVGCVAVVGCDAVVGCGAELGCDDIVQTGDHDLIICEKEVDVECNVRLVEVSEDNVVCFENDCLGEANEHGLMNSEEKNRDKGEDVEQKA